MDYRTLKTIAERLEYILQEFPETRNSDTSLMIKLWEVFYPQFLTKSQKTGKIYIEVGNLYDVPTQDDAKRFRAKMNSEGKYLPTSEAVARRRGLNIDEWRVATGYATRGGSFTPPSEMEIIEEPGENLTVYRIKSFSEKGITYKVCLIGGSYSCNCKSYQFMRKCKHIEIIKNRGKEIKTEPTKTQGGLF